jgi:hypothetical protein
MVAVRLAFLVDVAACWFSGADAFECFHRSESVDSGGVYTLPSILPFKVGSAREVWLLRGFLLRTLAIPADKQTWIRLELVV